MRTLSCLLAVCLVCAPLAQASTVVGPVAPVEAPPPAVGDLAAPPSADLGVSLVNDPSVAQTLLVTLPDLGGAVPPTVVPSLPVAPGLSAVLPRLEAQETLSSEALRPREEGWTPEMEPPAVRRELGQAAEQAAGSQEDMARGGDPAPEHDAARTYDGRASLPATGGAPVPAGSSPAEIRQLQRAQNIALAARSEFPEGPQAAVRLDLEAMTFGGYPVQRIREGGAGHQGLYRFELDGRYLLLKVFKDGGDPWAPRSGASDALRRLRGALIGAQFEGGRAVRGAGRLETGERFVLIDEAFPEQGAKSLHDGGDLRRFYAPGPDGGRATARMAGMLLDAFSYGVIPHDADWLARPDGALRWLGTETWTLADPNALSEVTLRAMGAQVTGTLARLSADRAAARAFLSDFLVALRKDSRLSPGFKESLLDAVLAAPGIEAASSLPAAVVRELYEAVPEAPDARRITPQLDRRIAATLSARARRAPLRRWLRRGIGAVLAAAGAGLIYQALARFGVSAQAVPWLVVGFNLAWFSLFLSGLGRDLWRLATLPIRLAARTAIWLYGLLPGRVRTALRWLTAPVWGPLKLLARRAPRLQRRDRLAPVKNGPTRRGFLRWTALAVGAVAGTAAMLDAPFLYTTGTGFLRESRLDQEVLQALSRGPQTLMELQLPDGSWGITQIGQEYHITWNSVHDRAAVTAKVLSMLLELRPPGWEESFSRGYRFLLDSMMLSRDDLRAARQPVSWNNEQPYMLAMALHLFLDVLQRPGVHESEAATRDHIQKVLDKIRKSTWVYGEGIYRRGSFQMAILAESLLRAFDQGFAMPSRFAPITDFSPDVQTVAALVGQQGYPMGPVATLPMAMEGQRTRQPHPDILQEVLDALGNTRDPASGLFAYSVGARTSDEYGAAARSVQIDYVLFGAESYPRYRGTREREAIRPDGTRFKTKARSTVEELRRARDRFLRFQPRMRGHVLTSPWVTHDPDNSSVAKYYYQLGLQYAIYAMLLLRDDPGMPEAARRLTASILDDQERDGSGRPDGTVVYSREAVGIPYTTAALLPLLRELMPLRPLWDLRRPFVERKVAMLALSPFLAERPAPPAPVPLSYPTWWRRQFYNYYGYYPPW